MMNTRSLYTRPEFPLVFLKIFSILKLEYISRKEEEMKTRTLPKWQVEARRMRLISEEYRMIHRLMRSAGKQFSRLGVLPEQKAQSAEGKSTHGNFAVRAREAPNSFWTTALGADKGALTITDIVLVTIHAETEILEAFSLDGRREPSSDRESMADVLRAFDIEVMIHFHRPLNTPYATRFSSPPTMEERLASIRLIDSALRDQKTISKTIAINLLGHEDDSRKTADAVTILSSRPPERAFQEAIERVTVFR